MKGLLIFVPFLGNAQKKVEVLPTPQQVNWANAEIGVIIHMDMNIFAPDTYHYGRKETLPPLTIFQPSNQISNSGPYLVHSSVSWVRTIWLYAFVAESVP